MASSRSPLLTSGEVDVKRREFISLGLTAVACLPRAAHAQRGPLPRIGVLFAQMGVLARALLPSLMERGYIDGKTAQIVERGADGQLERLPELARELVSLRV